MKKALWTVAAVLLATFRCSAHTVWIEPGEGGQLIVRFAEPDGKFETSPGHLDELAPPVAWKIGASNAPTALTIEKKKDHFALGSAPLSEAVGLTADFSVLTAPGKPGRLPLFYARWQPAVSAAAPSLTLDLVPTGKAGEVRVYFRGKPLGNVKTTLRTPDEKEQEIAADADGYVHFTSSQSGLHLLTLPHYRETLAGFAGGRAYDLTSHNAALTWRQP